MHYRTTLLAAILAIASPIGAQTLNIPASGIVQKMVAPSIIAGSFDGGNKEFDRSATCGSGENGSDSAIFILEDGASLSNVVIEVRQRKDAVSALGIGDIMITGGGAQDATDKVIQHNAKCTVMIKDFTVVNVGKAYHSFGNCAGNGDPRKVVITGLKASGVKSKVAGINSNYGDTATISGSCGSGKVYRECKGIDKSAGSDPGKVTTKTACLGAQGQLASLPTC